MSLIITRLALLACGAVGARCLPGLIRRRRPIVEPAAEPGAQGDPGASGVALDTASVVLPDGTLACFEHLLALADELRCDLDRGALLSVAPGLVVVAGVFTGAMGIAGALVMYNASMVMTVGYAMRPWLRRHRRVRLHPRLEPS